MLERLIEFMIPPHKRDSDGIVTALFERNWLLAEQVYSFSDSEIEDLIKPLCKLWFEIGYNARHQVGRRD